MTVQELIDQLTYLEPDLPVEVAIQPQWPLACTIESIQIADDSNGQETVWIAASTQYGYAPEGVYSNG